MKALHGMLCSTIGRLKRNASVGKCRPYLYNDPAISWQHSFQRRKRSINNTEISNFSHTLVFDRCHCDNWRKNRDHCIVDPNINWP